jgi:hypothetical protein
MSSFCILHSDFCIYATPTGSPDGGERKEKARRPRLTQREAYAVTSVTMNDVEPFLFTGRNVSTATCLIPTGSVVGVA